MKPLTQLWHEEVDGGWWSGLVVSDEPTEPIVVIQVSLCASPDDPVLEGDFDSEVVHINRGARTLQWPPRWPDAPREALLSALAKHYDWLR